MMRLTTGALVVSTIKILLITGTAQAECLPQAEGLIYFQYTDSGGYHDAVDHYPMNDLSCPVDYYSTLKEDQYEVFSVVPTFHFSEETKGGYDGISMNRAINADFSSLDEISWISMRDGREGPFTPFNITIYANDGYNDLNSRTAELSSTWNVNDAVINWHAKGGDDRLEVGTRNVDVMYGGLGNDWYWIANAEDRAIEILDEGFDVATIGTIDTPVQNYRFDPGTSIEAVFLYPGSSVDPNYLPPNIIFLKTYVDNRGPYSTRNIADVLPDILSGTPENDALSGGFGDSTVTAGSGNDIVNGGLGNDNLDGGTGNDALIGGTGNDNVAGGDGNDLIVGGSGEGNDTYNGGPGIDTVKYTSAKDGIIVNLLAKTNQAYSIAPGDSARIGVDQIALVENVVAGNFNDQVIGNKLANTLEGEDGSDLLRGEKGNDTLIGGRGSDTLIGGSGNEVFVYRDILDSEPSAQDTITDFSVGKEKIDLSQIDASTILDGNNAFMFNGASPIGTSSEGEISIVRVDNPGKTNDYMMIYIDTDADTDPEAAIRVNKLLKLSLKNFVL